MTPETDQELIQAIWPTDPPARTLCCRHCGTRNRVSPPLAIFSPERCQCGACDKPLFLERDQPLTDLSATAYEHSLDRKSLEALKSVPGFPALTRWLLSTLSERSLRLLLLSNNIRCGDDQFPELVRLLERARASLDLPWRPELFLGESPFINAMTMGVEAPVLVVQAATLDQLNDMEVVAVLAHELGHLHADHVLYKGMARLLLQGAGLISNVVRVFTLPLQLALLKWDRCSELTADRAAVLGSRDPAAYLHALLRMAGGNRPGTVRRTQLKLTPFLRQAQTLAELEASSWLDNTLSTLMTVQQSHPFLAWRVMHLLRWLEHGNYLEILAGEYPRVSRAKAP